MSVRVIDYYGAGALDNITKKENRAAFHKCRLLPRVMVDVSTIRPQTKIFGFDSALPIYISPASNALLGHPDGELNITRGVSATIQASERRLMTQSGIENGHPARSLSCCVFLFDADPRREGQDERAKQESNGLGIPGVLADRQVES